MHDVGLIRKVTEHIDAHQEQWDQIAYFYSPLEHECQTTACFAGWTLLLTGHATIDENGLVKRTLFGRDVSNKAAELLGLSSEEQSDLFGGIWNNSISDLWHHVSNLTSGEIEVPPKYL